MKEICSKKRSLINEETIKLSEDCSALILNKERPLVKKQRDPGSFTIPCRLDNVKVNRALCDLGVSVSAISYSIYKELVLVNWSLRA